MGEDSGCTEFSVFFTARFPFCPPPKSPWFEGSREDRSGSGGRVESPESSGPAMGLGLTLLAFHSTQ